MISDSTAKKLKEAGFKQKGTPTLSELAKACGVVELTEGENGQWIATGSKQVLGAEIPEHKLSQACGDSQEEATAKLWLQLNKNGSTKKQ